MATANKINNYKSGEWGSEKFAISGTKSRRGRTMFTKTDLKHGFRLRAKRPKKKEKQKEKNQKKEKKKKEREQKREQEAEAEAEQKQEQKRAYARSRKEYNPFRVPQRLKNGFDFFEFFMDCIT